jgi:hypothetical protein
MADIKIDPNELVERYEREICSLMALQLNPLSKKARLIAESKASAFQEAQLMLVDLWHEEIKKAEDGETK